MFNLLHLQQERAHKALLARDLIAKAEKDTGGARPMTDEEVTFFDKLTAEIENIDKQIVAIQAHEGRRTASAKLIEDIERPAGRITQPDQPANGAANGAAVTNFSTRIPATARRTGVLKAFKPRNGESADAAEMRAYRSGLWIRASIFNDQRAASKCMSLGVPLDLRNAMGTTSNTDGGFLVFDEMSQAIIDLRETYGVFRQNCRVWPMGSDTLMIPRRLAGVTIGPIGENPSSAISQSTPTFNQVQLVAKKCGGLSLMSSEIAEDAVIDLADWIANEFAYGFALFEDTIGFTGDGTSAHLGVRGLTTLFTEALGLAGAVLVATVTHNLFSEIDNTDLTTMMAKLPQYARMNAKFYCSSTFAEMVFSRLKATAGGNTVQTLQGSTGDNYLGYPIVISQVLPAGAATDYDGQAMCFFGDLSKSSSMGDRRMVKIFPSEHRYMDTDQIAIRGLERVDVVNHDVGDTTTAGPIVALVGSSS